jgi:hypothetical protein
MNAESGVSSDGVEGSDDGDRFREGFIPRAL